MLNLIVKSSSLHKNCIKFVSNNSHDTETLGNFKTQNILISEQALYFAVIISRRSITAALFAHYRLKNLSTKTNSVKYTNTTEQKKWG